MRPNLLVAAAALVVGCGGTSSTATGGSGSGTGSGNTDVLVTVLFTGKGSGRVTSSPAGIDCPASCSMTVPSGTAVTLTAQPDSNSTFVGWGGACFGLSCSFLASGES